MIKHKTVRDFILSLLVVATVFCLILSNAVLPVDNVLADTFAIPCTIETYGDAWEGYLAFGLWKFDSVSINNMINSYLVVMNTSGDLVAFRESDPWEYLVVKEISQDMLMFQGESNAAVHFWNLTSYDTIAFEDIYMHHDVEYNPETETFLALRRYVQEVNGSNILFDEIGVE